MLSARSFRARPNLLMKLSQIGIIGDVHAQDARLFHALEWLRARNVERILCVGDIADGNGQAARADRCCDLLRDFDVATVRGNHDRWLLSGELRDLEGAVELADLSASSVAWLRALPRVLSFRTVSGPLLLCHGVAENDMNNLRPDDYGYALENNDDLQRLMWAGTFRFGVGGHTHRRMIKRFGDLTWINPGALVDDYDLSFGLADFGAKTIEFIGFAGEEVAGVIGQTML